MGKKKTLNPTGYEQSRRPQKEADPDDDDADSNRKRVKYTKLTNIENLSFDQLKDREEELKYDLKNANQNLTDTKKEKNVVYGCNEIRAANTKRLKFEYLLADVQREIERRIQRGEGRSAPSAQKSSGPNSASTVPPRAKGGFQKYQDDDAQIDIGQVAGESAFAQAWAAKVSQGSQAQEDDKDEARHDVAAPSVQPALAHQWGNFQAFEGDFAAAQSSALQPVGVTPAAPMAMPALSSTMPSSLPASMAPQMQVVTIGGTQRLVPSAGMATAGNAPNAAVIPGGLATLQVPLLHPPAAGTVAPLLPGGTAPQMPVAAPQLQGATPQLPGAPQLAGTAGVSAASVNASLAAMLPGFPAGAVAPVATAPVPAVSVPTGLPAAFVRTGTTSAVADLAVDGAQPQSAIPAAFRKNAGQRPGQMSVTLLPKGLTAPP